MAFNPNLLVKVTTSNNGSLGQPIADSQLNTNITNVYLPVQSWYYQAGKDTMAEVEGIGYFVYFADWLNTLVYNNGNFFRIGDQIYCVCADGNVLLQVIQVQPEVETEIAPLSPNSVNTAAIQAGAVGSAEIANGAVGTAQIAAGAVTGDEIAPGAVGTIELASDTIQYLKLPITAAQFNGMYASPIGILPAPGAGLVILVDQFMLAQNFGTIAYAAGGPVELQYGASAHAAGNAAALQIAAGNITGMVASNQVSAIGQMQTGANVNQVLTLSNETAPFTTGDGTWNIHVYYRIVTA